MICPECGANEYFQDNWSRIVDENQRLRNEIERQAARSAVVEAKHRISELEREERQRWEQGKVLRQRERIKQLEAAQTKDGYDGEET